MGFAAEIQTNLKRPLIWTLVSVVWTVGLGAVTIYSEFWKQTSPIV